ncbi:ubiquinol-cytochrome C chaperone family protein [Rhizobium alvei]|uniref:Ubiquinol-cytochrome C chaperone family protein n=1 Tax=Rhizobium alvei TaxID=1132659 RepID=A0ABT8YJA9_9HYPH|nr:ubiquinol-cytochrome C chaperone family protein [Rhizobium alvei]MDO6963784.1 ubiquinol-cytochrome C chaperone family protein [Rhizobium alvei]
MIFGLFRKNSRNQEIVERQYAVLTAAAREPELYRSYAVPDTVIGRFEMLSTVLILYFRRTQSASDSSKALAQSIVEAFFEDIDHSMRELGISDHGVPKRMKKFASMFYGRGDSYGRALDSGDLVELEAALRRNFHPENADPALSMQKLAHYMLEIEANLKTVPDDVVARGEVTITAPKEESQG